MTTVREAALQTANSTQSYTETKFLIAGVIYALLDVAQAIRDHAAITAGTEER